MDSKHIHIPAFIIQPFVENAIWHGVANKKGMGTINVDLSMRDEGIYCVITDDGVGRERAMEIKKNKKNLHQSHGTKITTDRLNIISQIYNSKINLDIIDLYNENSEPAGTKVVLLIPVIKR